MPRSEKKIFDIAKAQGEPMAPPNGMAHDLRRKAVESIQRFLEPIVTDRR